MDWVRARAILQQNALYRNLEELSIRELYTLYKVASYLYYQKDYSLMTDERYDLVCKLLMERYDPDWVHVSKEDLAAGTGYSLKHGINTVNLAEGLA